MKLFLSGCETKDYGIIARDHGTDSLLFSNFHRGEIDLSAFKGKNLMMDSGLFTMMFGVGKGKDYTIDDLREYTDRYISDMLEMKWPGIIVEMDVHKVLGTQFLPEFRSKFESRWGVERTLFVWHVEEEVSGLVKLAKRYPYIALSVPELRIVFGKNVKTVTLELLKTVRAANPKCKVHLLGCTQKDLMMNQYYFSCDSSSWLMSVRYGGVTVFEGGKLRKKDFDNRKHDVFTLAKDVTGADHRTKFHANAAISAKQFKALETHVNERFYPYDNRPLV